MYGVLESLLYVAENAFSLMAYLYFLLDYKSGSAATSAFDPGPMADSLSFLKDFETTNSEPSVNLR